MKKLPAVWLWLLPVISGVLFVALWYAVRHFSGVPSWILPTPGEILEAAWQERVRLPEIGGRGDAAPLSVARLARAAARAAAAEVGVVARRQA